MIRPQFFRVLTLMICLGFCGAAMAASQRAHRWSGVVTHVTDGDTLWVRAPGEHSARSIRIDGIDAPEICQAYGDLSRSALAAKVMGQHVQVVSRRTDQYGRLIAKVELHGEDLGDWLVSRGHAWSYQYRRSTGPYARQEAGARSQGIGLFASSRPERPRDFRKRHGSCH